MWTYSQTTGALSVNGRSVGIGYSGHGLGKNNPAMQKTRNIGPIPQGTYQIGPAHQDSKTGPVSMNLTPIQGTNTFGRDAFLIHGDSIRAPGTASDGCIILSLGIRQQVANSLDKTLTVTQ
jgi:hypothetical protein